MSTHSMLKKIVGRKDVTTEVGVSMQLPGQGRCALTLHVPQPQ